MMQCACHTIDGSVHGHDRYPSQVPGTLGQKSTAWSSTDEGTVCECAASLKLTMKTRVTLSSG